LSFASGQAFELGFGLPGRDGVPDPELPLPKARLNLRKGKFNAPAVHDFAFDREGGALASSSASSFNKIWRVASSGASARRFLKRAKFSLWMNSSIEALSLDQAGVQHSQSPMDAEVGTVMAEYTMSGIGHKAKVLVASKLSIQARDRDSAHSAGYPTHCCRSIRR
jgi:hypothetical protein